MNLRTPDLEPSLRDPDELTEDDAEDAEEHDAEHDARGVEERAVDADVEAEALARREELSAHDADQRAARACRGSPARAS